LDWRKEKTVEKIGGERIGQTASPRQVAVASLIGTAIEWYDFLIFGTAAALVFNQLFFPEVSPLAGTLAAFATFWAGFIARPVGGVIFGHFGDRVGRKAMLVLTLLIMGIATFLIGLLPTYDSIGLWAPILLLVLRLLQGIGLGGEWGGAALMAVEHSPEERRGFYGSFPQMGGPVGLILGTTVFGAASWLPEAQLLAWGWRVPFLLSVVLIAVGLFVRLKILESPAFVRVKEAQAEARLPVVEVFQTHAKNVFRATGAAFANNVLFYVAAVFTLSYATTQLGLPNGPLLAGLLVASVIDFFAIPAWGALSDRVGRRPVIITGAVALVIFAFPYFWLLETLSMPLIWLALIVAIAGIRAMLYAPQPAFFSELFGTTVRYSGASLGTNLATVLVGGSAPLVATALLGWSGGDPWPVAAYMIAIALITLASVYFAPETVRSSIEPAYEVVE
jgi:MFS transporter, MHS family, shikimate and dehydroshikimate transport protein